MNLVINTARTPTSSSTDAESPSIVLLTPSVDPKANGSFIKGYSSPVVVTPRADPPRGTSETTSPGCPSSCRHIWQRGQEQVCQCLIQSASHGAQDQDLRGTTAKGMAQGKFEVGLIFVLWMAYQPTAGLAKGLQITLLQRVEVPNHYGDFQAKLKAMSRAAISSDQPIVRLYESTNRLRIGEWTVSKYQGTQGESLHQGSGGRHLNSWPASLRRNCPDQVHRVEGVLPSSQPGCTELPVWHVGSGSV